MIGNYTDSKKYWIRNETKTSVSPKREEHQQESAGVAFHLCSTEAFTPSMERWKMSLAFLLMWFHILTSNGLKLQKLGIPSDHNPLKPSFLLWQFRVILLVCAEALRWIQTQFV